MALSVGWRLRWRGGGGDGIGGESGKPKRERVETGVNCREWQSGRRRKGDEECLLRGRNKTMPFLERCRRRRRRRRLCVATVVWCRSCFSLEREKGGVAARDGLSIYVYIYIFLYICIYNVSVIIWVCIHGYVSSEKIFWTCTSRGSTSLGIMLRRQLGLERL